MSERSHRLFETAERQITELLTLVSSADNEVVRRQCPGREKLGDGTVAAVASFVADNYLRIVGFVHGAGAATHTAGAGHDSGYRAENIDVSGLVEHVSNVRVAVRVLADLTDDELDRVPPAGEARFCDGTRTAEQVLTSMLKHQGHQIDALSAAIA